MLALLASLAILLARPVMAELVRFRSATTPPTALQQRLAVERGQPLPSQPGEEIVGELYRPSGNGPFAAIVQLHGCDGRGSRQSEDAVGARYVGLGYALLIVDSFGPRGISQRCNFESGRVPDRLMDAYGALLYLAALPFIDLRRISLVGYSQGAEVALSAVQLGGIEAQFSVRFRSAIAYYPTCPRSLAAVAAPTLIQIGELDDWTPAHACQEMMDHRSGEGAPMRLIVYPGAYHAFTVRSPNGAPRMYFGHRLEYNEAAARAAGQETINFLQQALQP